MFCIITTPSSSRLGLWVYLCLYFYILWSEPYQIMEKKQRHQVTMAGKRALGIAKWDDGSMPNWVAVTKGFCMFVSVFLGVNYQCSSSCQKNNCQVLIAMMRRVLDIIMVHHLKQTMERSRIAKSNLATVAWNNQRIPMIPISSNIYILLANGQPKRRMYPWMGMGWCKDWVLAHNWVVYIFILPFKFAVHWGQCKTQRRKSLQPGECFDEQGRGKNKNNRSVQNILWKRVSWMTSAYFPIFFNGYSVALRVKVKGKRATPATVATFGCQSFFRAGQGMWRSIQFQPQPWINSHLVGW